jgi:hypothetical protein
MNGLPHYVDRNGQCSRRWFVLFFACALMSTAGCAATPYQYGQFRTPRERRKSSNEIAFEYGEPNQTLDGVRNVVDFPRRLFRGRKAKLDRELSEQNRELLTQYLKQNDLADVHVTVNQYDPKGEWERLRNNHCISAGWRYSAGVVNLAGYTILPGRAFGGEYYNPYTNTLQINSNRLPAALHEAAYAKDIHSRSLPGTYAVVCRLPVISLWKTSAAMNDVLGYAQAEDNWELERDTYREYCPQLVAAAAVPAGLFVTPLVGVAVKLCSRAVGGAVGYVIVHERQRQRDAETESKEISKVRLVGVSKLQN